MLNKCGFIPKKSELQPDYYRNIFNGWCAIFIDDQDNEYHLQMNLDPWAFRDGYCHAKSISILKQNPKSRSDITGKEFQSIKGALERLKTVIK